MLKLVFPKYFLRYFFLEKNTVTDAYVILETI